MARGVPLTEQQRQAIIADLSSGDSCNAIARAHWVSPDTVSRIAKAVGHRWGAANVAVAHEARKAYGAEHRSLMRQEAQRRAEESYAMLDEPHVVFSFGGRDNDYNERTFDRPDVAARSQLMLQADRALKTAVLLDSHDRTDEHLSDFDQWWAQMFGGDA